MSVTWAKRRKKIIQLYSYVCRMIKIWKIITNTHEEVGILKHIIVFKIVIGVIKLYYVTLVEIIIKIKGQLKLDHHPCIFKQSALPNFVVVENFLLFSDPRIKIVKKLWKWHFLFKRNWLTNYKWWITFTNIPSR